jgi:hypothetical protein
MSSRARTFFGLALALTFAAPFAFGVACGGGSNDDNGADTSNDATTLPDGAPLDGDATPPPPTPGRTFFEAKVQPLLASQCNACHLGKQFAFASLQKSGTNFTAADTEANYQTFVDQISVDAPKKSRLLAKIVGDADVDGMTHAGGKRVDKGDATYATLSQWIDLEKADRCASCGLSSPTQYIAYVEQPRLFWAIDRDPYRSDDGVRTRARIMMQPIDGATMKPKGAAFAFLDDSFCGADGHCDFGDLAVSHAGDRMAFECRLSLDGGAAGDWVNGARWNMCIAEIGADGKALNPRFFLPISRRHSGSIMARSDPFGLTTSSGGPLKGPYDQHWQVRRREDTTPVFSPDDSRLYFASEGPDPRTGADSYQTYHGYEALNHIVAARIDGSDLRTIYVNEGGVADHPFFTHDGNVAFHTWNLERMDRHLYTRSHADGMMELPVLLGRVQGPNMWGKATQLVNGAIVGITGRRRSSIDLYVAFEADHTLGAGVGGDVTSLTILDDHVYEEVLDFPGGYCTAPPEGTSCFVDRFYADAAWSPDGRALVAYSPNKTYVMQGTQMFDNYSTGASTDDRLASLDPYLPKGLGIAAMDMHGVVEPLIDPPADAMLRYPVWVGKRGAERVQPWTTDEGKTTASIHLADAPLWFSFRDTKDQDKTSLMTALDTIVSIRVLTKATDANACENDDRPYRYAVNAAQYDHPTHLGMNNATGYERYVVPASAGGDGHGDVPLQSDKSIKLVVPGGKLLLFQGVDKDGHVVRQHERVFALPPGTSVDTSIKRSLYKGQCSACHGVVDGTAYVPLTKIDTLPRPDLEYGTIAAATAGVDLTASSVTKQPLTFLHALRPILDGKCVSCHSGSTPGGELSLSATYSTTANYPAGKWASTAGLADPAYLAAVPGGSRVASYDYSTAFAWTLREDETEYKTSATWSGLIASWAPLADLAPWDPAYQNLFAWDGGSRWLYLGGYYTPNFGRSDRLGGISSDAFLIEVLTGKDIDPTKSFSGSTPHTGILSDDEVRTLMAVMDVGFPYMARCSDKTIASGPNAGATWGAPTSTPLPP